MGNTKSDLEIFIEKYQPSKFKKLKSGIEIRSVQDVDGAQNKAAELIKHMSLGLTVVRDATAAARGSFEIREVAA